MYYDIWSPVIELNLLVIALPRLFGYLIHEYPINQSKSNLKKSPRKQTEPQNLELELQ